jgi:hypothetical protein
MPLILLAMLGCRTEYSTFRPSLELVVTLEDPTPTAGDEVPYLAYMDGSSEPIALDDELMLISSREELLDWGDGVLVPTIAGGHMLTASTMFEGELYVVEVDMDVSAGPPALVDLALSDYQADAGEEVTFTVRAWDAYDNETGVQNVDVSVDSSSLTLAGNTLSATVPGLYTATASDGLVSDDEQLRVVAGPAASLVLELSDTDLEVDETSLATVTIVDAYGNPLEEDWDLWVEPGDDVSVQYNALTFRSEGEFTVYASTLDATLSDSVGPFLIDSTGPLLEVLEPERGTETTAANGYVSGTASDEYSGVWGITVNGDSATVQSDGTWEVWQEFDYGTNVFSTEAIDWDGNKTTDIRAAISGNTYNSYGYGVGDGLQARINEDGFDTIESLAAGFIDTSTLESAIPNPILDESSESCIWGWCITWYSIYFTIDNPSISATTLDLDPDAGGYLDTTATIYDPHLEFNASGKLLGISYSQSGSVDADWIALGMELTPYVSSGSLGVEVGDVELSESGFDFDLDGWLWDIIDFFGIDIDGLLWDVMSALLEDMAADEIPALVADALGDLEIGESFDVEDQTYHLDMIPYSVSVDDLGLTLGLETYVTADTWETPHDSPGSLMYPYTAPTYSSGANAMVLGVSQDFLNQLFHALWAGGLLEMEMPSSELGLDLSDLGDFLPISELSLKTSAYLPPVIVPGTGSELLDLQIGDLEISLYDGDIDEANLFMRFYISLIAGFELSSSGSSFSAGLGDTEIEFDLVYPNERSIHAEGVENFLGQLVDLLLPTLTEALGEFPIPEISGFTLDNVTVELDGAEDGYVTLGGDLSAN